MASQRDPGIPVLPSPLTTTLFQGQGQQVVALPQSVTRVTVTPDQGTVVVLQYPYPPPSITNPLDSELKHYEFYRDPELDLLRVCEEGNLVKVKEIMGNAEGKELARIRDSVSGDKHTYLVRTS